MRNYILGFISGFTIIALAWFFTTVEDDSYFNDNMMKEGHLKPISTAFKLYKLDNFMYPAFHQGLNALIEKPKTFPIPQHYKEGGYLKSIPTDHWGNKIQYIQTTNKNIKSTFVFSFGKDGLPGGNGPNKDAFLLLYQQEM